ncbi:G1/S-specific cyclin-E protein [Melia azedarach]|nr:G1/S-specific cyclin-E protein [Melia azedarach]
MSPFRNNKTSLRSQNLGSISSSSHQSNKFYEWLPVINVANLKEKACCSLISLCEALHGFIVFEVVWKDVRGMSYLNDLQNDASFALEVKVLRKWEFNGINQALSSITSWFSGTHSEMQILQSNLVLLYDQLPSHCSHGITYASKELLFTDASKAKLLSEDLFFDVSECPKDTNDLENLGKKGKREEHNDIEPREYYIYSDAFLLLKFNDMDLPFKLQQIITCDLKLLTLLEAGLPSWVIFLQSYPIFCKVYSPWMLPLLGTLYILISVITVIIAFYDLYKNIPLLKATMSHLCGPLFEWIEAWDRISRIRYLGTMLFLQNLEKAIKGILKMIRVMKLPALLKLMKPFTHPLGGIIEFMKPVWKNFAEMGSRLCIITWVLVGSLCTIICNFVGILLSPLVFLCLHTLNLATMICTFFNSMWKVFLLPTTRGCLVLANNVASIFFGIYQVLERAFIFINIAGSGSYSTRRFTYLKQVKPDASKLSLWNSLWNDLFSKVFNSLRNIIHGLVAFFTSCNQHRQSIYNHLKAIFWWLCCLLRLAPRTAHTHTSHQVESHHKVGVQRCDSYITE